MKIVSAAIVCLLLQLTFTYSLTSNEADDLVSSEMPPLTFPYRVGTEFGHDKINAFINFINSAASLYRNDIKQNLLYVQSSMAAAYAGEDQVFGFIIQINITYSLQREYASYGDNFVMLEQGISMINPTWSFCGYFTPKTGQSLQLIVQPGQGKGINETVAVGIQSFVQKEKTPCTCSNKQELGQSFWRNYEQRWNVFCFTSSTVYAYVPVSHDQWMLTKASPCNYLLFEL